MRNLESGAIGTSSPKDFLQQLKWSECIDRAQPSNASAGVHMGLADLATEQESFEEALSDYTQALALLEPLLKVLKFLCEATVLEMEQLQEAAKLLGSVKARV